jgi:uncharacterized membrane protein YadS
MELLQSVFLIVLPYLIVVMYVGAFFILYKWARKRKAAAIGLGMMMHLFMPVPNVEKSIVQIVEKKQIKQDVTKELEKTKPK